MKQIFYPLLSITLLVHAQELPDQKATATETENQDPFANAATNHEEEEVPALIIQSIELIEVPLPEATRLLFDENLISNSPKLREELRTMIKDGKASVYDTLAHVSSSSEKSTSESIQEMTYATEYEPPELPNSILIPEKAQAQPDLMRAIGLLKTAATPTAFEPRNVGSSMESKCVLNDDGTSVNITLAPEWVKFHRWIRYNPEKDVLGNQSDIRLPIFGVIRLSIGEITIPLEAPQFIGLLSVPSKDGTPDPTRKLMAFLRCNKVSHKTPAP